MYIRACNGYSAAVESDELVPLRAEIKATLGINVRRVNRFIELALLAVGRTADAVKPETGIYLGSGRGDVEVTIDILEDICRDGHSLRPLSFIHSVSNAACFYIAKSLGLHGMSQFASSRYLSCESVLNLALLDMQAGRVPAALVGTVDVVTTPLAHHHIRVERADTLEPVAEASYWLQLEREPLPGQTLAEIIHYAFSPDLATLLGKLSGENINPDATCLIAGQFIAPAILDKLTKELGISPWDKPEPEGYFDSQCGYFLQQWLSNANAQSQALYIGGGPEQRFFCCLMQRC